MITKEKAAKADERNNLLKIVFTWDGVEHNLISAKNLKEKPKVMNPNVLLMIDIDSPGAGQFLLTRHLAAVFETAFISDFPINICILMYFNPCSYRYLCIFLYLYLYL